MDKNMTDPLTPAQIQYRRLRFRIVRTVILLVLVPFALEAILSYASAPPPGFVHRNGLHDAGYRHVGSVCVACLGVPRLWRQAVEWRGGNLGRQMSGLPNPVVHSQALKGWPTLSIVRFLHAALLGLLFLGVFLNASLMVSRPASFIIALSVGLLIGVAYPFVDLAWSCRLPTSEACVWGKAYFPLTFWASLLLLGAPATGVVYAILKWARQRKSKDDSA
jgi:hypothetical protein